VGVFNHNSLCFRRGEVTRRSILKKPFSNQETFCSADRSAEIIHSTDTREESVHLILVSISSMSWKHFLINSIVCGKVQYRQCILTFLRIPSKVLFWPTEMCVKHQIPIIEKLELMDVGDARKKTNQKCL